MPEISHTQHFQPAGRDGAEVPGEDLRKSGEVSLVGGWTGSNYFSKH